jgi:hypothetical protein
VFFLLSCGNANSDYKDADNAINAGREFIDACLKGDFVRASYYMVQDSTNKEDLAKIEKQYRDKDRDGRRQYREASINISEIANPTESITIINYSNSFDRVGHKIKVIQQGNKWLVDFKYTFNPNL